MTTNPSNFYETVAQTVGIDLNLMTLARQRTQSYFGTHVTSAQMPELREPGWQEVGEAIGKVQGYSRTDMNALCRYYATNDPMVKHALDLHNVYTFGRGVSPVATDKDVHEIIMDFWQEPTNRSVISTAQAQYDLNKNRQLDGELFFLLYVNTNNGTVRIRVLPPGEVTAIIYADNDPTRPETYKREYTIKEYDYKTDKYKKPRKVKCYLPDYRSSRVDHNLYKPAMGVKDGTEIYVYHVCTNAFEGRGLSHFATAMAWVKAFKGFMEDRVTLQMALALFAFKTTIKGNQAALDRSMSRWSQYENTSDGRETGTGEFRERRVGATNWFENEAMNMEQFHVDTGAANAYLDGRMVRQQAGVGMGIHENYLSGDATTGSWASMNAMELPMLKTFESEQQLFGDMLGDIFTFVIYKRCVHDSKKAGIVIVEQDDTLGIWRIRGKNGIDLGINVRFPDIVAQDAGIWLGAIAAIKQVETYKGEEYIPARETRIAVMGALGFEDAVAIAESMETTEPAKPTEPTAPPEPTGQAKKFDPLAPGTINKEAFFRPEPGVVQPKVILVKPEYEATARAILASVGKPLSKKDGTAVEDVTEEELDDTFDEFADLPDLDTLLDDLGITEDDLDDA